MRVQFVLPGLHRTPRGAEAAFESVARELAATGRDEVTLIGSGGERDGVPYRFHHASSVSRERFERFPRIPPLRNEYRYEELTFMPGLVKTYRPSSADVTLTCSYPFVNWYLSRWPKASRRPKHVFVTQNGDWPAYSDDHEYRFFSCDGLVCTNPDYFERNRHRWTSTLIPNGVDVSRFSPGRGPRERFGIPQDRPVVLMVSALVESKRVAPAIRAVADVPDAFLVVAGDGPERRKVDQLAGELLPDRFRRLVLPSSDMPSLYRCADVLLHTSLWESFGNIYVEALACGLPVVAHAFSVTTWCLGEHAYLVDAASQAELTAALTAALAEDPARAPARVVAAAERFTWAHVAAQYREFLAGIVGGQGAAEGAVVR
jgi:glycosyltransferase involved in cell wall biosynthesis